MTSLPKQAVVLGTGGGALSIAAELALKGVAVTLGDFPQFLPGLEAVAKAGGIQVTFRGEATQFAPVAQTCPDPKAAVAGASLVFISVPCFGHAPFAKAIAPVLEDGQTVIWAGEGGGAFAAVAALREIKRHPKAILAETNSLPYNGAMVQSPGVGGGLRKTGGTYIGALPSSATEEVSQVAAQVWPWVKPAQNIWEALLINFNAIDHVAALITNLSQAENRKDRMKLWGEGLSPGVGKIIGKVDEEFAALRKGLGLNVEMQYEDYLVEQGLVDRRRGSVYDTMMASYLTRQEFPCGPKALEHRFISEDVPYSLVLAASLGDELGIKTPVVDSLITLSSAASGHDYWAEGRTLAWWGLKGAGRDGLVRAVEEGWW